VLDKLLDLPLKLIELLGKFIVFGLVGLTLIGDPFFVLFAHPLQLLLEGELLALEGTQGGLAQLEEGATELEVFLEEGAGVHLI
jgi:hypothetical protein